MDKKRFDTRLGVLWLAMVIGVMFASIATQADDDASNDLDFARDRAALLKAIEADVTATSRFIGFSRLDPAVMAAMAAVERHRFVPEKYRDQAYENHPLPIGYGQTISQPYIVALMTNLLALAPGDRVLEVGTGSGYQAAVLARMGMAVFSIEIIAPLAQAAMTTLDAAGYAQVRVRVGDGYLGWPDQAPFDAIIVTAAADHIPPPLLGQLKNGGRMVIPVGGAFSTQHLVLVSKDSDGDVSTRQILPVRFVPLTRGP